MDKQGNMDERWVATYGNALRRKIDERLESVPSSNGNVPLDGHQQEAMLSLSCALEELSEGVRQRAFSVVHNTGAGKTLLAGNVLLASQAAKTVPELGWTSCDLVLTTERSNLYKWREELEKLGVDFGIWGDGRRQTDRPVVLASIQALQRNSDKLATILDLPNVPLIVGDEADLYLTPDRKAVVRSFPNAIRLGFTATPEWPDGRHVSEIWGPIIHRRNLKEAILRGDAPPPVFYLFESSVDLDGTRIDSGDYARKAMGAALREAEIHSAIPEIYARLVPDSKRKDFPCLVFVPTAQLVHDTVATLKKSIGKDVSVVGWTGNTPKGDLISGTEDFKAGRLDVLVLCEIGGRALDLPNARVLIDGYPTLSATKLEQRHGRVLRKARGGSLWKKPFAIIAQIVPTSAKTRPALLPDVLDCWDDFQEGRALGASHRHDASGNGYPESGAPIGEEVRALRALIENASPGRFVSLVRRIDAYRELRLRSELPKTDADGFVHTEEGRLWTLTAWWAETRTGNKTLRDRLSRFSFVYGVGKQGITVKLYREIDVRTVFPTFGIPSADSDGFVMISGVRYGTMEAWSKMLGISRSTLVIRFKETGQNVEDVSQLAFSIGSATAKFYSEPDVRRACEDLSQDLPKADTDNFIRTKEGKTYATVKRWGETFGISENAVKKRMGGIEALKGKDNLWRERAYFEKSAVEEACADLITVLPKAGSDGIILTEDGKEHSTALWWATMFGISDTTLKKRVAALEPLIGKDRKGRIQQFFEKNAVAAACSDLLEKRSK